MRIVTRFWMKPIPPRQFDWIAHYEGDEEDGPRGYGATEAEAIADLTESFPDDGARAEVLNAEG